MSEDTAAEPKVAPDSAEGGSAACGESSSAASPAVTAGEASTSPGATATGAAAISIPPKAAALAEIAKSEEGSAAPEGETASTMGFLHWMVDLQHQLLAMWERRDAAERKHFKALQDAKFEAHKKSLHKKTIDQFGAAHKKVELLHEENLRKGQEVKRDTECIRQAVAVEREQWIQHGHDLTVQHGRGQLDRTKQALAESTADKAEQGRRVRIEGRANGKDIYTRRSKDLDSKRDHVQTLKKSSSGKVDESMSYTFNNKREAVREVQRVEDKWKRLSTSQRDSFRAHAGENHKSADDCKEHARQIHAGMVRSKNQSVRSERQLKQSHAKAIADKRSASETAKRAMRDVIFSARAVPADKTTLMRAAKRDPTPEKIELAAKALGLIDGSPPLVTALPSSPYRPERADQAAINRVRGIA